MCECIKELEAKVMEHALSKNLFKKKILKVSLDGKVFSLSDDGLSNKVVSRFEVTLEGQKKKALISCANSFCQFCGEKLQ
jgi:hypothetical protein